MTKLAFAALALLIPALAAGEPYRSLPSAARLSADIDRLGAREVLFAGLWPNARVFESLLLRVETGSPAWLDLASRLKRESDAGASESLIGAVSVALARRPSSVLRLLSSPNPGTSFSVRDVCSGRLVFLEQPKAERKWRKDAALAVWRVRERDLSATRDACLAAIDA